MAWKQWHFLIGFLFMFAIPKKLGNLGLLLGLGFSGVHVLPGECITWIVITFTLKAHASRYSGYIVDCGTTVPHWTPTISFNLEVLQCGRVEYVVLDKWGPVEAWQRATSSWRVPWEGAAELFWGECALGQGWIGMHPCIPFGLVEIGKLRSCHRSM